MKEEAGMGGRSRVRKPTSLLTFGLSGTPSPGAFAFPSEMINSKGNQGKAEKMWFSKQCPVGIAVWFYGLADEWISNTRQASRS